MKEGVAYYRVSTDKQGESGLGLEAQKEAVQQFAQLKNIRIEKEFVEVESGKKQNRPVLKNALLHCADNKQLLLIAKLDRLGRNVAFVSALMETKVQFIAADNPEANDFVLHIMVAFAQYEREQISKRTKEALQAAKRRGVQLGKNGEALAKRNKEMSEAFCRSCIPIIHQLQVDGFNTIKAITNELNKRSIPTFRPGSRWHKSTVHSLIKRQGSILRG